MPDRPVCRRSAAHRWLKTQATKRKGADATHLLLDGGSYRVEPEQEQAFLTALAVDIERGNPNYVVEHRTHVFAFCQDFDFFFHEPVDLQPFMRDVQLVLARLLPDVTDRMAIVCQAPIAQKTRTVTRSGKPFEMTVTKTGYHVIYPFVLVTKTQAMNIRHVLLDHMERAFPTAFTKDDVVYDTWDEVLDLTIYTANGLRMLGSHKAHRCACRAYSKKCESCRGAGFLDDGRPYEIVTVWNGVGNEDPIAERICENAYEQVRWTTIRRHGVSETRLVLPDGFKPPKTAVRGHVRNRTQNPLGNLRYLNPSDIRFQETEAFLKVSFPYSTEQPQIVKLGSDGTKFYAVPNHRYCQNVGREHGGQDIFYILNETEAVQRCWSDKVSEDRLNGPCIGKDAQDFFDKQKVPLPPRLRRLLFDHEALSAEDKTTIFFDDIGGTYRQAVGTRHFRSWFQKGAHGEGQA